MSTPVFPFNLQTCQGQGSQGSTGPQGPPGPQGPAPALAIGNVTALAPGTSPEVAVRTNPAGGYFLDFGIPQGPAGTLTQDITDALYAKLAPNDGTYRVITNSNGTFLEFWNPDQMKWHALVIRGGAGAEQTAIEPAES